MSTSLLTVKANGPLLVKGEFEIQDAEGNAFDLGGREAVAICRCGLTQSSPFCDGSHKGKFESPSVAHALPPINKP